MIENGRESTREGEAAASMWPTYVINLDGNDLRLGTCARQLNSQGIPWTRLPAVDGRRMTDDEIARHYDAAGNRRRAKHPLVRPEIGCFLSHLKAWDLIAAGDAPGAFVLEDDFTAANDLGSVLRALSAPGAADGWDMVKLFTFRPDVRLAHRSHLTAGYAIGFPYRVPSTTLGYAITRKAAGRLARSMRPIVRPVDEEMKFFWEHDLRVALVLPPPIVVGEQATPDGTVGDVRKKAMKEDDRPALTRIWQGLRYRIGYTVGLHRAHLARRGR